MGKLIVVIEDDKDILDLIKYILSDEGYTVEGYLNIKPIDTIIGLQPSLILLDNRLADGNGSDLCLTIKSNPSIKHIPVILLTAGGNIEGIANSCKADGFLPKPFDLADLVLLVREFC